MPDIDFVVYSTKMFSALFSDFSRRRLFRSNSYCFNAKGKSQGFITSGHQCFAWIRIVLALSVSCLISALDIPFWKCALTPLVIILHIALKTFLYKNSICLCEISSLWCQNLPPVAHMLLWPRWIWWKFGLVLGGCTCTRWHGWQKLSTPRYDQRLRSLTFAGWSQECLTSTLPKMCCLLRLFLIRFWILVSISLLPSRVSCVHIQTCTTHKLLVDRMQAWNRKCPLMP